ncbi:MAG: beta-lactamase family protein [Bacteroidetes bacterium]|nr:beta-lactamase family protein [Bacteroidota bacterium]
MKKIRLSILLVIVIGISSYGQVNKPVLTDNKMKTFIDTAVNKAATIYLQDSNTNGISIGIYFKGIKYTYNYGEVKRGSHILPTADNFYNLGSVAKPFISTMLAEAVIEKKAKLTDDIRKYLPSEYPNLEYQGHPIRLIDLANHTSSLPKEFHTFSPSVLESLGKLDLAGQINYFNSYNQDSLLTDLHKIKPDTIPGIKYNYNGNATMLLMLLVERIYHQPYEKVVTQFLRSHFKMNDTKSILSVAEMKRIVQGYNDENEPQHYTNYTGFTGGPSMNSTINDMLKFLEANILEKDKAIKLTHQLTWGDKNGFALGLNWMMDTNKNGERFIFHDGHTGIGFNTHCIFYPKQKSGFIIIVNDIIDQDKVSELEKAIKADLDRH